MPDRPQSTPPPPNAFDIDFLSRLLALEESTGSAEAVSAGPWKVLPSGRSTYLVLRTYEDPDQGDVPEAVCRDRDSAYLLAAALPATGRDPLFLADPEEQSEGFAIQAQWGERGVQVVGHTRTFNQDYAGAMHVAACIARSPLSIVFLLMAAGPEVCSLAGRLLWHSVSWMDAQ